MIKMLRSLFVCFVFCVTMINAAWAQTLKPGFDAEEYIGVLQRCSCQVDENFRGNLPKIQNFDRVYISAKMGLHNKWDLWLSKDKTTIAINLRGTTNDKDNWLENFYS